MVEAQCGVLLQRKQAGWCRVHLPVPTECHWLDESVLLRKMPHALRRSAPGERPDFGQPNIELSCAAASTHSDCIYERHSSSQKQHKATTAAIC